LLRRQPDGQEGSPCPTVGDDPIHLAAALTSTGAFAATAAAATVTGDNRPTPSAPAAPDGDCERVNRAEPRPGVDAPEDRRGEV